MLTHLQNLFWTARALGIQPHATLAELREAGRTHCTLPWSELHLRFGGHVPLPFVTRYCFGAAYVFALMHERLGVGLHERVLHVTNTIGRPTRAKMEEAAALGAAEGV